MSRARPCVNANHHAVTRLKPSGSTATVAMKLSGVLCAILAASAANADVYTFPAKSVNLGSAYSPAWFKTATLASQLSPATDAHAVHGIELADGGYVLTGKAIESDGSAVHEAFATKFSASGDLVWAWKSGVSGQDAANAAAQLPNGQVVIAGKWINAFSCSPTAFTLPPCARVPKRRWRPQALHHQA